MRKIIILLTLFVTTCSQRKISPQENPSPKLDLTSISNEIYIFTTKLGFLSEPNPEKVSGLFFAITKRCNINAAIQKEFMGYPQYIYTEEGATCIWNQCPKPGSAPGAAPWCPDRRRPWLLQIHPSRWWRWRPLPSSDPCSPGPLARWCWRP